MKINKQAVLLGILLIIASFLRLYKLDSVPVSLFGDELDVGYHAYSILHTGKDYYGNFMPLHLHSLAEWRTPLYLYSAVPTVMLFGISPLGVRLPAAIFGILGVLVFYFLLKEIRKSFFQEKSLRFEYLGALVLALSPWHIQYSRAAFEVTLLLLFFTLAVLVFLKTLNSEKRKGRWLWVSTAFFALTPWVYSTAKVFTPIFMFVMLVLFTKELMRINKKYLFFAAISLLILGAPIAYSTVFGGGSQRFSYISIFSDPTVENEIGVARETEAKVRGETGEGLSPTIKERLFNNKYAYWGNRIVDNYLSSLSFNYLFSQGDPNPRHTIDGIGLFYRIEVFSLPAGAYVFVTLKSKRFKTLLLLWVFFAVLPAALTRDGGNHSTRLFILLPPFVILIALGLENIFNVLKNKNKFILPVFYLVFFIINFLGYQNLYWNKNLYHSERWWHYGWAEAIKTIKVEEQKYEKVVISTADEPPWIFFAANYEYPPQKWQEDFPLENKKVLSGFGEVSYIDKFYFGSPQDLNFYDWNKVIDSNTLYLASAKEVGPNLIKEPERTPGNLNLVKAVSYPSGEPAFYIFSGK